MNRGRWIVVGALVLVVAAGAWWVKSRGKTDAPRYRTAAVERGSIELKVSATGTVRPVIQVQVGSQVSGTVQRIAADYNSRVRKGDLLCQLEPSAFRARELQSQAAVARAEAALKDANRQYARAKELLPQNYISQADVDAAQVAVEQRQADLKQARAQLEAADVDLANTTIRAPIDGVVIARSIDVGQTVAASLQAPQLFVLANDLTRMQVETRIDEADIGQIRAGLPVTFTVDAFPDAEFQGEVSQVRLEPIVDQGVVTYTTVILTRNPDLKLRPGMTANVSVLVDRRDDVLRVPAAALRFRPPMEGRKGGKGGAMAMAGRMGGERTGAGPGGSAPRASDGAAPGAQTPVGQPSRGGDAQGGAMAKGGPAAGGDPAASGGAAPDRKRIWEMVREGRLTRDQARKMMSGAGGPDGGGGGRQWAGGAGGAGAKRGGWSGGAGGGMARGSSAGSDAAGAAAAPAFKPGVVWVMRAGQLTRVPVETGLSDGTAVEVRSSDLQDGDQLVVGLELPAAANTNLQPPPGMGGPRFGPGGGGRGGGGGRR